jgi:hypothetical protein
MNRIALGRMISIPQDHREPETLFYMPFHAIKWWRKGFLPTVAAYDHPELG